MTSMSSGNNKAAIVIPCFNEEKRLPVAEYMQFISKQNDIDLVFVNDGSTDATLEVLYRLRDKHPSRILVLGLQQNIGKGNAVREGFSLIGGRQEYKFCGYWDADLSTPLSAVKDLMVCLERDRQLQIVTGCRLKSLGRTIERSSFRHYLGRVFATAASLALGLGVYDTQCGAKIFRCSQLTSDLFKEQFLSRWLFDVEIFFRLQNICGKQEVGVSLYEYPLKKWVHVGNSKVAWTDFFIAPFELIKLVRFYRRLHA